MLHGTVRCCEGVVRIKIINYALQSVSNEKKFPGGFSPAQELFILCRTREVADLRGVFGFDISTVLECTDLDESVRFTGFPGYDFISLVHMEFSQDNLMLREINMYVSSNYFVIVMPEHESPRITEMENKILRYAESFEEREHRVNGLYYAAFHHLLSDFSDTLENLEDRMQQLSEDIVSDVKRGQFSLVNILRNTAYAAKKHLRALSYIGDYILLDENGLINKKYKNYFHTLNTRFKKLYDFAESLYSLSGEMLDTFDSRMSMKTNDTVNKLTVITLFFGPLTVITGIYGMNFDFMPELGWAAGYPLAILLMLTVSLILYRVLKKKKWL